jgi:putative spermidine/putrescine transport system permease protein
METAAPLYFSLWHRLGVYAIRAAAIAVLVFLLLPVVVVIPLSFNAEPFFTFTEGMLTLQADAYSLRWYEGILADPNWILAIKNSFIIAIFATIIATTLGTLAAVGLASGDLPFRRLIIALLLSPMIVPLIIIAAGIFFFYSRFDLIATYPGVIIAHAALGVPFVVITVTATLSGFDRSMYNAGLSLGANPLRTFRDVVFPLIRPGVISGAVFAFVTSFDEVVVILFIAGPDQRTIPRQMFSGLREQINPTILAVATLLVILSIAFLATLELLRRRSQHLYRAHGGKGQAVAA